jgi:hypothetical protein
MGPPPESLKKLERTIGREFKRGTVVMEPQVQFCGLKTCVRDLYQSKGVSPVVEMEKEFVVH